MKVKAFAASLGVVQSQADAWLKRLVAEGRVKKEKTTYRAVSRLSDQPKLFEVQK
jgi:predicted transcriptional regulator